MQGLPFSIVPMLEAKSCCPVQELLCGIVLFLSTPMDIDVVAVDVKQWQQREVPSRDTGQFEATDPVVIVDVFQ
jgi:hypothetical protein